MPFRFEALAQRHAAETRAEDLHAAHTQESRMICRRFPRLKEFIFSDLCSLLDSLSAFMAFLVYYVCKLGFSSTSLDNVLENALGVEGHPAHRALILSDHTH